MTKGVKLGIFIAVVYFVFVQYLLAILWHVSDKWHLILGVKYRRFPFFRSVNVNSLFHWLTRGRRGRHRLAGGWCPLCGAIYNYDEYGTWDKPIRLTPFEQFAEAMEKAAAVFGTAASTLSSIASVWTSDSPKYPMDVTVPPPANPFVEEQNSRAAEFDGLTESQARGSEICLLHGCSLVDNHCPTCMSIVRNRHQPSDRDLEVARHIQQDIMTTGIPNDGSPGISRYIANMPKTPIVTHEEEIERSRKRASDALRVYEETVLKGILHPWIRHYGFTFTCSYCNESLACLCIQIPETLKMIEDFAREHALCLPPRQTREIELGEG